MIEAEKRQNLPIEVLFYCIDGKILKVNTVKSLLPFGFVEDRLQQ
jgi:cytidine deaminase